ncbi:inner membrane protein YbhL [Variibacter gotjawalensis]|uniref:Inner membrane protein YbhL n=1 Tax=Variibacter gotjawalensis TaxID=1333996 RepID=A0A0S3PR54_9BRAD|nr:Bax inhibitor-1/YccA family protein [Variibacter gotjawalensis]NIK48726.1 hypothetical protein [Variibacter gotjawalensis]RZS50587.1 hypothetical protein EV661_3053 [Variibacter gotjawalensis]BAT58421.1 inner membrane protein YbhL [Variibacter gotjawalensis]
MSDFDRNAATAKWGRPLTGAETSVIDAGLRAYMLRVYNYMVLGLAVTGFAALGIFMLSTTNDPALAAKSATGAALALKGGKVFLTQIGYTLFVSPLKWAVVFAPLAFVFFFSYKLDSLKPSTAQIMFLAFATLIGVSLATVLMVYTSTSIARVFFITAASFGALSLWGYTTQKDISSWGSFLFMGLIGVVLASLVNIFLQSSMLQFIMSVVGVLVFAGLTAWDTQRIKSEYVYGAMQGDVMERSAISGALSLYLNFINMFTLLLNLFGDRE